MSATTNRKSIAMWSIPLKARRLNTICGFVAAFSVFAFVPGTVAFGQVSPEEHARHHPGRGGPADGTPGSGAEHPGDGGPPAGTPRGGPGEQPGMMGGGMGGMMEQMGAPKPKQLYPSLMDLPDLPMEERAEVQRQAHERMKTGAALLSDGLEELSQAAPGDDFAAMQDATATIREGLARFESGLAAHRALAEGKAPRNVALQWFKREMNLLPPAGAEREFRIWGMTPFHASIMAVLVIFAGAMIWMYFFKMRRAADLLNRLAAAEPLGELRQAKPATKESSSRPSALASPRAEPSSGVKELAPPVAVGAECCDPSDDTCPTEADAASQSDLAAGLLPIRKKRLCRLRVARIDQETPDVKTFRFVACHGGSIPFSYLPGHFLTLTLPVGDKPIRRSYTISSSPTQGYYCEITVKREEHGVGSRFFHDKVKVGDTIQAQGPSGKFFFTGKEADSIVLIAGGVGITPMMSVTRALTDMAWEGAIYFIVACHDPEHFIFESELKRLQERYSNLQLHVAMSQIKEDMGEYRSGRLSRELLAEWVPEIASRRIHICGPPAMMDGVKTMLGELDVPAENVFTEAFGGEQKPRPRTEKPSAATDVAQTGGTLTFSKSDKSTPLQPDETILDAAERIEVDIDYSCRVGMCGVCTVKLLSGEVSMEIEDGLEPDEKEAGMILACQAKSTGDVNVEA